MRSALFVTEVALAVALVIASGLLVRTLLNLQRLDSGYTTEGVLSARVSVPGSGRERPARQNRELYDRIVRHVAGLPGVEEAALTVALLLGGRSPSANVRVEGRQFPLGTAPDVSWRAASPRYFETLRIPLLQGRVFDAGDAGAAPPVTIVNRTLAELLWPGESALGRRIGTGLDGETELATIVGVVGDTPQDAPGARIHPEMFRPLAQETRYDPTSLRLVLPHGRRGRSGGRDPGRGNLGSGAERAGDGDRITRRAVAAGDRATWGGCSRPSAPSRWVSPA